MNLLPIELTAALLLASGTWYTTLVFLSGYWNRHYETPSEISIVTSAEEFAVLSKQSNFAGAIVHYGGLGGKSEHWNAVLPSGQEVNTIPNWDPKGRTIDKWAVYQW